MSVVGVENVHKYLGYRARRWYADGCLGRHWCFGNHCCADNDVYKFFTVSNLKFRIRGQFFYGDYLDVNALKLNCCA